MQESKENKCSSSPKAKGRVCFQVERCKGCGYCIAYCPRNVLELSPRYNVKGYHPPLVKKPDDCVNCHYCETICPDFAIYSLEIPLELPQPAVVPESATEVMTDLKF